MLPRALCDIGRVVECQLRVVSFLGRTNEPTCKDDGADTSDTRSPCHWPALIAPFDSVHSLAAYLATTDETAFMIVAAHAAPRAQRSTALSGARPGVRGAGGGVTESLLGAYTYKDEP